MRARVRTSCQAARTLLLCTALVTWINSHVTSSLVDWTDSACTSATSSKCNTTSLKQVRRGSGSVSSWCSQSRVKACNIEQCGFAGEQCIADVPLQCKSNWDCTDSSHYGSHQMCKPINSLGNRCISESPDYVGCNNVACSIDTDCSPQRTHCASGTVCSLRRCCNRPTCDRLCKYLHGSDWVCDVCSVQTCKQDETAKIIGIIVGLTIAICCCVGLGVLIYSISNAGQREVHPVPMANNNYNNIPVARAVPLQDPVPPEYALTPPPKYEMQSRGANRSVVLVA